MTHDSPVDCIVVGAGFSGLTAALALQAAAKSVVVLEARERVGGRTEPGRIAGLTVDLGGMWLGSTQPRLARLAESYAVSTYPMRLDGDCELAFGGKRSRARGEAIGTGLGFLEQLELARLLKRLTRLAAGLDRNRPWAAPESRELDACTVHAWAQRYIRSQGVRERLDVMIRSLFCCEPDQLSLLFFLFYLKAAGGLEALISAGPGGAQQFLFHGGVHQIAQHMAQSLGRKVRLESEVRGIRQDGNCVHVATGTETLAARHVIVAAPPGLVQQIQFEPDLPHGKRGLLQRQPMGACIKVWIAYATPFWRAQGLNGLLVDHAAPFSPVFDVTPPGCRIGVLCGFFDADAAALRDSGADVRRETALATLAASFGSLALEPIDYIERDWRHERWSQGCYGAYMGPGVLTRYGSALRAPVGRLHWAGTETATIWSGYIEGAIESGERAAREVIDAT